MIRINANRFRNFAGLLLAVALGGAAALPSPQPLAIGATLSEWNIELSRSTIAEGRTTFTVRNAGSVPHAFEIEGRGIERATALIQPGATATLTVNLEPGTYEVYCPIGGDSHKKLGMETLLKVGSGSPAKEESHQKASAIWVSGGRPVIQILPGPFPFPDSAAPILRQFGDERSKSQQSSAMLLRKAKTRLVAARQAYANQSSSYHHLS